MYFLRRSIAIFLSILMALTPVLPAQAAIIGNDQITSQGMPGQTRDGLQQLLDREIARQQLQEWGVKPDQIKSRIARLTDAELVRINRQINDLHAGGDVIGILLILFLVFVITDIFGATDIFPFINKPK